MNVEQELYMAEKLRPSDHQVHPRPPRRAPTRRPATGLLLWLAGRLRSAGDVLEAWAAPPDRAAT
jgi:hypothetical protein